MVTEASVISGVRNELGDQVEPFRDSFRGTGDLEQYDLSAQRIIEDSVTVFQVNGDGSTTNFSTPGDYTLNPAVGVITFTDPPEEDARMVVEGSSYSVFSDAELTDFVDAAVSQHLHTRTVQKRFRDGRGFIQYDRQPMTLETMPDNEKILVVLLSTIESLWALATDSSTDIDVQTSEGTSVPRTQRFRQIVTQIDLLTNKYKDTAGMMGVGLFIPESLDMRRISRTTGRLIPLFEPREYDDNGSPVRKVPPKGNRDSDPDGPPSPYWSGGWGF